MRGVALITVCFSKDCAHAEHGAQSHGLGSLPFNSALVGDMRTDCAA